MSPEIYTIIAVGVALAGLILNGQRNTAKRITELRRHLNALSDRVNQDISALSERVNQNIAALGKRVDALGERVNALGERVARLEGLMEGIRDIITGKAA